MILRTPYNYDVGGEGEIKVNEFCTLIFKVFRLIDGKPASGPRDHSYRTYDVQLTKIEETLDIGDCE